MTGCENLEECLDRMCEAYVSSGQNFWANMVKDNMYEVQFTMEENPKVIVVVGADSGFEAGKLARLILKKDFIHLSNSLLAKQKILNICST